MSIETQAIFYMRNVYDYDPGIECDFTVTDSLKSGFTQFSSLLRTIYEDWHSYEVSNATSEPTKIGIMTDDLENYHNLTYTVDCLYAIALAGEICSEGSVKYLRIPKHIFKGVFKKSVTLPFCMLEKYGFGFVYYKDDKKVSEYKRCNSFHAFYENGADLIEAIKFIADRLTQIERKKEMPERVAFMLADYYFIMTGSINQNPLQEGVLKTIGAAASLWKKIVTILQNEYDLIADSSFNPYVFPNRTVTFRKNKKTVCKFGINVDSLSIRLPLSFEMAKELVLKRDQLPQSINKNIDLFGCVRCCGCKDQEKGSLIEHVNEVPICTLPYSNFQTEDSRCLRFVITKEEEIDTIIDIISRLYK